MSSERSNVSMQRLRCSVFKAISILHLPAFSYLFGPDSDRLPLNWSFLDGNGRIGRLLITLYLVSNSILNKPSLYLSAYLEKHRGAYYDALTRARESHDIVHWVRFFLEAIAETAESGKRTFQKILTLRQELEREVVKLGRRAENARRLITFMYSNPAITAKTAMNVLGAEYVPTNKLIAMLVEKEILHEVTGTPRNRIFLLKRYVDIFVEESLT